MHARARTHARTRTHTHTQNQRTHTHTQNQPTHAPAHVPDQPDSTTQGPIMKVSDLTTVKHLLKISDLMFTKFDIKPSFNANSGPKKITPAARIKKLESELADVKESQKSELADLKESQTLALENARNEGRNQGWDDCQTDASEYHQMLLQELSKDDAVSMLEMLNAAAKTANEKAADPAKKKSKIGKKKASKPNINKI